MSESLVYTVKNRCRVCYTCVRECPVKAIKIINGQAEVIAERCIACGNCVNVCSQGAKAYRKTKDAVYAILNTSKLKIAALAPSFPAEFNYLTDYRILVAMIHELGFDKVIEVAFGADLTSKKYKEMISAGNGKHYITSDCPAVANYVRKYHPELTENLAPIASPMVATARVARKKYGADISIVFIGPCIAKKDESNEIDEVITFAELSGMFSEKKIAGDGLYPLPFDPPYAGKGAIFPVSRGLMQTMGKTDDICEGNIIVAEGKQNFKDAIREFENGLNKTHHLELLCCEGCILGPGMSLPGKRYARRSIIGNYVFDKLSNYDQVLWQKNIEEFEQLDLSQTFSSENIEISKPDEATIKKVLEKLGKYNESDHLNCGACGYDTCYKHALAIAEGLAESEMCLPYTIETLHKSIEKLNQSNNKLASAREALKQSEKLATMGQLSAGIAHELNNPLGVITMYSNILKEEISPGNMMREDLELIVEQAERCKNIVGGLLNFARKNQVKKTETHLPIFVERSLNSVIIPENVTVSLINKMIQAEVYIDKDQMMQVLTNLEKNAIEAMPDGGILTLELTDDNHQVFISISDTGIGIPEENMPRLFTPFFTTKALGKGTGLGLPLIYGIIKMHKGKILVESNSDNTAGPTGTTFKISIPRTIE